MLATSENGLQGLASMGEAKKREIAIKGAQALHAQGKAHQFTSEEAREANAKARLSKYPAALAKAIAGTLARPTMMELKTGTLIRFREAKKHGTWMLLPGAQIMVNGEFSPPVNVEVSISEISWVADTPTSEEME